MMIGEKIQTLRKQYNLPQEQLADRLSVSRQAISKWEQGDCLPDIDNIIKLSDIFNVTTDYLLKNGHSAVDSTATQNTPVDDVADDTKPRRVVSNKNIVWGIAFIIFFLAQFVSNFDNAWVVLALAWAVTTWFMPDDDDDE